MIDNSQQHCGSNANESRRCAKRRLKTTRDAKGKTNFLGKQNRPPGESFKQKLVNESTLVPQDRFIQARRCGGFKPEKFKPHDLHVLLQQMRSVSHEDCSLPMG